MLKKIKKNIGKIFLKKEFDRKMNQKQNHKEQKEFGIKNNNKLENHQISKTIRKRKTAFSLLEISVVLIIISIIISGSLNIATSNIASSVRVTT